ncbi:MAG: hypothetical protein DMF82_24720 [Acidobacteria bacterium]|nr:MAG: hypothetical protein DMF82_24720 [Acidobacteriota bacterium]
MVDGNERRAGEPDPSFTFAPRMLVRRTPVSVRLPRVWRKRPIPSPPYGVRNPIGGARSALPVNDVMLPSGVSPGMRAASASRFTTWNQVDDSVAP